MKLLLDQGLPRSTVQHLAAAGIVAEHVGDLGLSRADDAVILETARRQQAVVVTLDADFHYLLATTRATAPSVIRLRVEGLKGGWPRSLPKLLPQPARNLRPAPSPPSPSIDSGFVRCRSAAEGPDGKPNNDVIKNCVEELATCCVVDC